MTILTSSIKNSHLAQISSLSGGEASADFADEILTAPERFAADMGASLEEVAPSVFVIRDQSEDEMAFDLWIVKHACGASTICPVFK